MTTIEAALTDTDQRYTPPHIIEQVRLALGGTIGLDPTADPWHSVPALYHITQAHDCFVTPWQFGLVFCPTVFMNPPYSNSLPFLERMCAHIENGWIDRAITLTLAGALANKRTQPLIKRHAVGVCHPHGRINFVGGKPGGSNDRDVVFILWGKGADIGLFREHMEGLTCQL
jgi:hypothetical protein